LPGARFLRSLTLRFLLRQPFLGLLPGVRCLFRSVTLCLFGCLALRVPACLLHLCVALAASEQARTDCDARQTGQGDRESVIAPISAGGLRRCTKASLTRDPGHAGSPLGP
jgi:hypothetical protein